MKICKKCNIEKELINFHKFNRSKDGVNCICKLCKKEYDIKYRQTEKVQSIYKSKIYRDSKKEYQKARLLEDPRLSIFRAAKARAKKYNLEFNIEIEDIIIPEYCPYLEIPIFRKPYFKGTSFCPNSPSLDKIIPEKGYTKNNIMVISMKANAMKYNATIEELKLFSKNIQKLFK